MAEAFADLLQDPN